MYLNEAERANWDIYNDLKLKKTFGLFVYINISALLGLSIRVGTSKVDGETTPLDLRATTSEAITILFEEEERSEDRVTKKQNVISDDHMYVLYSTVTSLLYLHHLKLFLNKETLEY